MADIEASYTSEHCTLDPAPSPQSSFKYCSFYCEENIWHLVQDPCFAEFERVVAVIANTMAACLFWNQRACEGPEFPVWWDYHVVLLVKKSTWLVYDLDTLLPCPSQLNTYLSRTFQYQERMPASILPRFLLFDGDAYARDFSSDRSHMRNEAGDWQLPPPDWPPIDHGIGGFHAFIEHHLSAGSLSLEEVTMRFARA